MHWTLDGSARLGGNAVDQLGSPSVIDSEVGPAMAFDGIDDALIVPANPLAGLSAFTVEVVFRPDPDGAPEQRFLHFQEVADHRALIETRLTQDGQWFLDTFLKAGEPEKTLYAKDHLHPVGPWYHAALTYDGTTMRHFVNGIQELAAPVSFSTMQGGQTSIGCRLNRVYWFKGAIASIRVSPRALEPDAFSIPASIRPASR